MIVLIAMFISGKMENYAIIPSSTRCNIQSLGYLQKINLIKLSMVFFLLKQKAKRKITCESHYRHQAIVNENTRESFPLSWLNLNTNLYCKMMKVFTLTQCSEWTVVLKLALCFGIAHYWRNQERFLFSEQVCEPWRNLTTIRYFNNLPNN